MDGDLQNDPTDIPAMIAKLETEGLDVVAGRRANRQDGFVLRKIPSSIANALIRRLTGVYIHDYGCSLKVMKQDVAKNLGLYGQLHRFIPVLASIQGAKIAEMDVKHHARVHGTSKYCFFNNTCNAPCTFLVLWAFFRFLVARQSYFIC